MGMVVSFRIMRVQRSWLSCGRQPGGVAGRSRDRSSAMEFVAAPHERWAELARRMHGTERAGGDTTISY